MAAAAIGKLTNIFGPEASKGIDNLVQKFDFSKIDVTDKTAKDYLHVGLAPSFGNLNSESIKGMDEKLKVMIAGTMRSLEAHSKEGELSWDGVMSVLMQNPLLEADDGKIDRSDKLIKSGTNVFKFNGSPDESIVKEVEAWFVHLIGDPDVLADTKIDIDVLANIVAQTGATVQSFESIFFKHESHEKTLVDIGILRFPDIDKPFFKVYRIKLTAWSSSARVLMIQEDQNGITGEFNARNFRPRASVIEGMKEETKKLAVAEAESLFG
ncbi:hypothetical protein Clacol_010232 [Clathrus columnatus]|uniref:Uncharacterized protein n=1 Tax=Clathrus columnatus TaxID=1419009 RepID=A0AAV5ASH1_9AGAM|nr:hypothetical protein Clacol_010232 [Clathrus columnatus]